MKNERRKATVRALVAAAFAVSALAWAPSAIAAQSAPLVTGTVVNGTTGKIVPDLAVTLHLFSDTAELGSMKATTDAKGVFSFSGLATDAKGYQVTAVYKSVLYRNQMAALTPGTPVDVKLKVYDTTTDPANVVQASWIVWVDEGGTTSCTAGACVQHDIQWTNSGDTAFTGTPPQSGGSPVTTQVPIAAGATNFQFRGVYLETPGQVEGNTYVNPQPIVPGTSGATLRYDVQDLTRLTIPVTLPTTTFEMYVPAGVNVTADGLTSAGEFTDRGITYQRFTASALQAGSTIDVSLSGLGGGSSSSKGSVILIGILGGLILVVAGGLALWKLAGRGNTPARGAARGKAASGRPSTGKGQQASARSKDRRQPTPARVPANRVVAEDDQDEADEDDESADERFDLLISEIAALDVAHEQGLLQDRTYEALRADAKERLLRLQAGKPGKGSSR